MKNNNNYGMLFGSLMYSALKTHEYSSKGGTYSSIYETLINIDNGTSLVKGSYDNELKRIKSALTKGLNAFLKRKLLSKEREQLEALKERLILAYYIMEINYIINEALEITNHYKEWDSYKNKR